MSAERWIEEHRARGHHPYPAPTKANPEQWECKCDPDANWRAVWRILTLEQTQYKFSAMFGRQKRREPEPPCCYGENTCLTHRRTP